MQAKPIDADAGVDPRELDRHIAEMSPSVPTGAGRGLRFRSGRAAAEVLGYPPDLLDRLPASAVSSFAGVGYPLGLAGLAPGERVLDLGSGCGMDVFAAAAQVGPGGSVTGVDIALERLAECEHLSREEHVSFRWARIEELPFPDGSFDAVISNGVVGRSRHRRRAFAEAARVLRPGGRLALADIVTERQPAAQSACEAYIRAAGAPGASQTGRYLDDVVAAGLDLQLVRDSLDFRLASRRTRRVGAEDGAHSISLLALKPLPTLHTNPNPDRRTSFQ
jgi:arsenite methyltransferase